MADYTEMTASAVLADLKGPGSVNEDGEVWDGDTFVSPSVWGSMRALPPETPIEQSKAKFKAEYLKTFKNRITDREREVKDAESRLISAVDDLRIAEANADRWYGS